MKLLCQALIVALIVSSHERFAHGKTLSHKKHHRSTNRKHNKHAADAIHTTKTGRHSKYKQKHRWSFGDSELKHLENIDEILEIRDNDQFANRVFQMMKDDDSDVLKDIDEDEEPSLYLPKEGSQRYIQDLKHNFHGKVRLWNTNADTSVYKRQMIHPAYNYTVASTGMTQQPTVQSSNQISSSPLDSSSSSSSTSPFVTSNSVDVGKQVPAQKPSKEYGSEDVLKNKTVKSSRVCKPGPPLSSNKRLPNCLLIGDSITLGSSYTVAAALQGRCAVQVSPFSKGGCALDSSYGLKCIQLILSTTNLTPTRFDAIVFNFGMHDIDYSGKFPEEFNDEAKYARNLGRLKKILLKTGAGIAFSLTTPVPYDERKNKLVVQYNDIAKKVMSKAPPVDVIDLYSFVTEKCGKIPFKNCFMMKKPKDVHYGLAGSILLGKQIAAKIASILKKRDLWVQRGYSLPENATLAEPLFNNLKEDSVKCSKNATIPTRCPSESTCVPNSISRSNFACCMLENGVDCKDNFHCCPENTVCHKKCSPLWCRCIPLSP